MPMNKWTGGQYSLFRIIFGTFLFVHFVQLVPWGREIFSNQGVLPEASASPLIRLFPNVLMVWDSPAAVTVLLVGASVLSLLFTVGLYDRAAAIALWYAWACLYGRNPLISNPSLPYIGLMLLAHACLPPAPYGSWRRRSMADPGSSWRMPQLIYLAIWIVMALSYTYSGYTRLVSPSWLDGTALARVLESPLARISPARDALLALPQSVLRCATWSTLALELLFAPLALSRRLRPYLWSLMLALHLTLVALISFAELSLGMVMLHLFTFDPGWIRAREAKASEMLFYDGHCGLCHRAVRFVLAEDVAGNLFRFAPLDGAAFRAVAAATHNNDLPDSLVVRTDDGILLTRSNAALHILRRLGGAWRVIASLAGIIPVAIRDRIYDVIAHNRRRLFSQPAESCPIIPVYLQKRFD